MVICNGANRGIKAVLHVVSKFGAGQNSALWARSFICILNPVDVIAVAILEVVFCVVIAPCAPPADES